MKVRIKEWAEMEREFGIDEHGDIKCHCNFIIEMKHYCGKIIEVDKDKIDRTGEFEYDGWYFDEGTYEIVEDWEEFNMSKKIKSVQLIRALDFSYSRVINGMLIQSKISLPAGYILYEVKLNEDFHIIEAHLSSIDENILILTDNVIITYDKPTLQDKPLYERRRIYTERINRLAKEIEDTMANASNNGITDREFAIKDFKYRVEAIRQKRKGIKRLVRLIKRMDKGDLK